MPEFNPFKNKKDLIQKISLEKRENILPNVDKFKEIAEDFDIKVLGAGTECLVVDDPDSNEKAIAINYKDLSPEDAKDIYYSSKIWSTLFPHNFPKIYAAIAKTENGAFNGTVREKIDGKTLHDQNYSLRQMMESNFEEKVSLSSLMKNIKNYLLNIKVETKYPFADALKEMEFLSKSPYNLPFFIDGNTKNFIKTDNGDEYYVDTMRMGSRLLDNVNISAVENYMREKGYNESDLTKVVGSIKRLSKIFSNNK